MSTAIVGKTPGYTSSWYVVIGRRGEGQPHVSFRETLEAAQKEAKAIFTGGKVISGPYGTVDVYKLVPVMSLREPSGK